LSFNVTAKSLTADVRVSERVDGVIVTPRQFHDGHALTIALRESLRPISIGRRADGVWLKPFDSDALLAASEMLDLRWNVEASRFVENRARIKRTHNKVRGEVLRILDGGPTAAESHLTNIRGIELLDAHQRVNVAAMTIPDSFGLCVFDEQGAGKTVTFIYAFDVLVARDLADFALIIAPKSMIAEWPRDFAKFKTDLYSVAVLTGSRPDKLATLARGADVFVTNFETAVSFEDELRVILRRRCGRAVLAVDESFFAKNLDAQRTRSIRRLREWCGRAFVLCGTPAPNAPHDLVQQFNIVDFGYTFDGFSIPKDRIGAQPVIREAIHSRGLYVRHLKAQVLPDLPAKRFHRLMVTFQPKQRELYLSALQEAVTDLSAIDDNAFQRQMGSFLARRSALLQICSNPVGIAKGYTEVPAKLGALDSLLHDLVTLRKEKVVLWSFFTASVDAIVQRYLALGPVRYDGSVSDIAARREAVRRFQEDDDTLLFVGNPAAAGAGLTLHRARFAIYESMSNQAAHYLQSVDRIHRRGQTRAAEYIVLLCDASIEVDEYDRLLVKERAAQELLGDDIQEPVTRESMLNEFLTSIKELREDRADT
jgi:SNF2 family DNA or RNA helicase